MGAPDIPDAPNPAKRPERQVDVEPEDIELGGESFIESLSDKTKGKRSLLKPTGGTASTANASGVSV